MKCLSLVTLFFSLILSSVAFAADKILYFTSTITVDQQNANITETISIYSNQSFLIRYLPLTIIDAEQQSHAITYDVQQVLLNGNAISFKPVKTSDQLQIQIGKKDDAHASQIQVYTLQYRVNHLVQMKNQQAQLQWNITGNDWNGTILKAESDIQLPIHATQIRYQIFTGRKNVRQAFFYVKPLVDNKLSFGTSTALRAQEGLAATVFWENK